MPTETPPDLMDVIDHAMETGDTSGTLDGTAPDTGVADSGDIDADGHASEGADTPADDVAEDGTGEGKPDAAAAEQSDEAGKVRDPVTGKFTKAEGDKGAAKPIDKQGDKHAVEAKKPDALNDAIPKDLKKETQDRIRTLIDTNKDTTAKFEKATQDFGYLIDGIKATGTTPEQYGELLQFMAAFNSKDPATQARALEMVESVADRLATLLGKERAPSDVLSKHPDLQEAVAKGQVTPQYAKEIARTRNGQAFRTEIETSHNSAAQARHAAEVELTTARTDLNTLEAQLQASDPQYDAKRAALVPILQPIFKTIPPSQWKGAFDQAYKNLRLPAAARAAPRAPTRQPMRAGGSAQAAGGGALKQDAGSMLDAMNEALAGMNQ